ncbi:MAG: hypothetical protein WAN33_11555 [Candidatus Acidiferrales bacterium]
MTMGKVVKLPSEQHVVPQIITRSEMSAQRLNEFVELVGSGDAVDRQSVDKKLRKAQKVAFVERDGKMVAVAAMKKAIPSYAKKLSKLSGYDLADDVPELGYVVVLEGYRGQHLSTQVVQRILPEFNNRSVFATTSDAKMKCVMKKQGFRRVGNEWDSKRPGKRLSLWIKEAQ